MSSLCLAGCVCLCVCGGERLGERYRVCAGGVVWSVYSHTNKWFCVYVCVYVCVVVVVGLSLRAGSQCCVITWLSATEPHWSRDRSGAVSYTTQRSSPSEPLAQSLFSLGSGHNMGSLEKQARPGEISEVHRIKMYILGYIISEKKKIALKSSLRCRSGLLT